MKYSFRMKKLTSAILFFVTLASTKVHAQGCSDAGLCTMQHLDLYSVVQKDSQIFKNDFSIGIATGIGDDYNSITTPYFSYGHDFSKRFSLVSKIVGSVIAGNKGNVMGLGDIYESVSFKIFNHKSEQTFFLAGLKLPFNNSDKSYHGQVLPLSYQTSLGTIDLIMGVKISLAHFDFNALVQIPVAQYNRNTFFARAADTIDFASTNLFRRKSDLLLSGTYYLFNKRKDWKFSSGILGIYHLGNDSYADVLSNRIEILGSEGLTLNAVVGASHYFKDADRYYTLSLAAPFVVRDIRPDGLTRAFVATFDYHFKF